MAVMAKNLLIGLGGTGAKLVESFVHLCAAGLGPRSASVAFIDQDQSNGNTARARQTLAKYAAAREALRGQGAPEIDSSFLKTELLFHPDANDPDGCHWVPQGRGGSLAGLIGYDLNPGSKLNCLARALFLHAEELEMVLDEGYRGRPHVGSAAFLMDLENADFWETLEQEVQSAHEGVRVLLCGSAFGGTGAAVLPTLARRLREAAREKNCPLRTGAALMLPYFTFAPPDEGEEANVAAGNELLLQSKSALKYYETERGGQDYSFDDLYFIGWEPMIQLAYHSAGAQEQRNPPLGPEIFGALAAARFLGGPGEEDRLEDGGGDEPELHVITRAARGMLDWSDLPSVDSEGDGRSRRRAYGGWIRFCALWRFNYSRAFGSGGDERASKEAWYRRNVGRTSGTINTESLDDYVEAALQYAAAISALSAEEGRSSFNLWDWRPIAKVDGRAVDGAGAPPDPRLEEGEMADRIDSFGDLLWAPRAQKPPEGAPQEPPEGAPQVRWSAPPRAHEIHWSVSNRPREPKGLWPFVARLHKEAARDLEDDE